MHALYGLCGEIQSGRPGGGKSSLVLFSLHFTTRESGPTNWTALDICMKKFCIYVTSKGSKHRELFFATDDQAKAESMASLFNELRRDQNEKYTIEKLKIDRDE